MTNIILKERISPYGEVVKSSIKDGERVNRIKKALSPEEKKAKAERTSAYKKHLRAYETAISSPTKFTYFGTLTSGLNLERTEAKLILDNAAAYLRKSGANFFAVVQPGDSNATANYHVHALTDRPVDLAKWAEEHRCNGDALYMQPIRDLNKAIDYIIRFVGRMPKGINKPYRSNYKKLKSYIKLTDVSKGTVIYSNLPIEFIKKKEVNRLNVTPGGELYAH